MWLKMEPKQDKIVEIIYGITRMDRIENKKVNSSGLDSYVDELYSNGRKVGRLIV